MPEAGRTAAAKGALEALAIVERLEGVGGTPPEDRAGIAERMAALADTLRQANMVRVTSEREMLSWDGMSDDAPMDPAEHARRTRDAYDRLAPVWSATTDDGAWNGHLERPALRSLVPPDLSGATVLEAGCGSGAQAEWLLDRGAEVIGVDLSPAMVEQAKRRCGDRGHFLVADLAKPLPIEPGSIDGITCSLVLHYLEDWTVALASFGRVLGERGWVVLSLDHPFAPALPSQRGGYFDTELVRDTWTKADVEVTQHFWRRPLGAAIDAFADAGFAVDRIAEPQPSREAFRRFPDELGPCSGVPSFIVYRLRLAGER